MKKSIVISGIKHSGKTTLGKMLAQRMNSAWYDLDQLIMNRPENSCFSTLRQLFQEKGKAYFQEEEMIAAQDYLRRFNPGTQNAVLSLGGGSIENGSVMELLKDQALVLYFSLDEEVLIERILAGGIPPFLSQEDPRGDFHRLYEHRDTLNRQIAHHVVELCDCSPEENLERIWTCVKNYQGCLKTAQ